ncbi:helix-turn-helix domain-containing protein [Erysipelothrix sp. D19-032]
MTLKPLISVIGEYVVDELEKNNLTQRQFAKISGVSRATLVKIIRGDKAKTGSVQRVLTCY